jgi:hypothetical protein
MWFSPTGLLTLDDRNRMAFPTDDYRIADDPRTSPMYVVKQR